MHLLNYPYFTASLLLSAIFALCLILDVEQRKPMIWSALLSLPCSFSSLLFVPEYWQPVRIIGGRLGIEDLLFSSATGGLAWLLAVGPFRRLISLRIDVRALLRRYLFFVGLGTVVLIGTHSMDLGVMNEALLGITIVAVVVFILRRDVWPIALAGGAAFTVIYTVLLLGLFKAYPNMSAYWNTPGLWGIYFFDIPLEEISWAFAFGAAWPSVMAYAFNAQRRSLRV